MTEYDDSQSMLDPEKRSADDENSPAFPGRLRVPFQKSSRNYRSLIPASWRRATREGCTSANDNLPEHVSGLDATQAENAGAPEPSVTANGTARIEAPLPTEPEYSIESAGVPYQRLEFPTPDDTQVESSKKNAQCSSRLAKNKDTSAI